MVFESSPVPHTKIWQYKYILELIINSNVPFPSLTLGNNPALAHDTDFIDISAYSNNTVSKNSIEINVFNKIFIVHAVNTPVFSGFKSVAGHYKWDSEDGFIAFPHGELCIEVSFLGGKGWENSQRFTLKPKDSMSYAQGQDYSTNVPVTSETNPFTSLEEKSHIKSTLVELETPILHYDIDSLFTLGDIWTGLASLLAIDVPTPDYIGIQDRNLLNQTIEESFQDLSVEHRKNWKSEVNKTITLIQNNEFKKAEFRIRYWSKLISNAISNYSEPPSQIREIIDAPYID